MPRILVVDDEVAHAQAIASQLEAAGFDVDLAHTGQEATNSLDNSPPDLVLADFILPHLTGVQLCEKLAAEGSSIPVVLMTATGSDDLAAKALARGAASYIPKARVEKDLIPTIRATLSVQTASQLAARAAECLVSCETEFELENDQSLVAPIVGHLQSEIRRVVPKLEESMILQLGMALQEALLNAIHHGNLEVSSDLREQGPDAYQTAIAERCVRSPYKERRVRMSIRMTPKAFECTVADEGPGFDPATVPDPREAANLERASGRGLYLIVTFMDEVEHNGSGNRIRMLKRFD